MAGASLTRAPGTPGASTTALLAFGALAILLISSLGPAPRESLPVATLATVALSDDDGGAALFEAARLAPGRTVSNCLSVAYHGAGEAGSVRVLARDVAGPLAAALTLRIDVGLGGRFGDCAGFSGTTVYDGALSGLDNPTAAQPGAATGWSPRPGERRTYRMTATVHDVDTLQGTSVAATLTWLMVPEPPSVPPTAPATTPPATPATTPATTPAEPSVQPSIGPSGASAEPATPSPQAPGGAERGTGNDARSTQRGSTGSRIAAAVGAFGEVVADLGARMLRHGGFPLASLVAMAVFLIIQDRFDRRDPKLALARVCREPSLSFDDPDWEQRSFSEEGPADDGSG